MAKKRLVGHNIPAVPILMEKVYHYRVDTIMPRLNAILLNAA